MDTRQCGRVAKALVEAHRAVGVDADDLAEALTRFVPHEVGEGAVIYRQGEPSVELQVLAQGSLSVRVDNGRQEVARLDSPALIGHLGVLTGRARSATVVALAPTTLARLPDRELWRIIDGAGPPGVALRRLLLASMVGLLERTNSNLEQRVALRGAVPTTAPAAPTRRRAARPRDTGASDDWGFDADLLEQAESMHVVESEADKARRFRR